MSEPGGGVIGVRARRRVIGVRTRRWVIGFRTRRRSYKCQNQEDGL